MAITIKRRVIRDVLRRVSRCVSFGREDLDALLATTRVNRRITFARGTVVRRFARDDRVVYLSIDLFKRVSDLRPV